jgi:uncharacterized protein YdeI (YjbR/CyaY-like superfamily)
MNFDVTPIFFETPLAFRTWLLDNHASAAEVFVGYYKVNSGKPSMTWSESVDQALCFGWIDGVRKSIDSQSYMIRFTRRNPRSIWSNVNIKKVAELTEKGLMQEPGLKVFNLRSEERSGVYSFENEEVKLSPEFEQRFKENVQAWENFQQMPPSYRKPATNWVMSAKQEATRIRRLEELIRDSAAVIKIKTLRYP